MRAFAPALGQPEDALESLYLDEPHHLVKLIRYPGRNTTGSEQGVGAHKDVGLLTLLLQDTQEGLQVETADGWVGVPPRPGTFVVNIGELRELASDGQTPSMAHFQDNLPAGMARATQFPGLRGSR